VNAAFLLVATAFVAGSDPVQVAPVPANAPIVSNGCGCNSCDTCNTCNTCEGKHRFGGFRGLFAKNDCGCDSCGGKHHFSGLGGGCGCGGGFSLGLRERFSHKSKGCDTCNECAQEKSCGCGIMESPLSRLGGLFRKKSCGCSSCDSCNTCSSCGGGAIIQGAPPVGPIPVQPGIKAAPTPAAPPQKMPAPPAKPVTSQLTPTGGLIIE
jgi:hypothetical protein